MNWYVKCKEHYYIRLYSKMFCEFTELIHSLYT